MKRKINDLSSSLSKCGYDKNRLKSMSQKKQDPKNTTCAP